MITLEELIATLKRAGAGEQQIRNETANWHKAQAYLKKPMSERPTPWAAFATGSSRSINKAQNEFWSQDPAVREAPAPEPSIADLRAEVQRTHPDKGGDPAAFIVAKKKLDKARKSK